MGFSSLFGSKPKQQEPAPLPAPAPTPVLADTAAASSVREAANKQRRASGFASTNLSSDRSILAPVQGREHMG